MLVLVSINGNRAVYIYMYMCVGLTAEVGVSRSKKLDVVTSNLETFKDACLVLLSGSKRMRVIIEV